MSSEPTPDPKSGGTSPARRTLLFILGAVALAGGGYAVGHATAEDRSMRGDDRMRADHRSGSHGGTHAATGDRRGTKTPIDVHDVKVESEDAYLAEMIPHHEEAIESAKLLEQRTDDPQLKAFARSIVTGQGAEVRDMQAWRARWYADSDERVHYHEMMRKDLDELEGKAFEQAFLEDMIEHHMMAVHMSHALLRDDLVKHDEVRRLAEHIIDHQHGEILKMHDWLA